MYTQVRNNNEIPRIKKQDTYPTQYSIELLFENLEAKLRLNKNAAKLLEHIEIVKEARKLYSEGKVVDWEEFLRNEAR
ncbi:MAG: hypothetical protein HY424_02495 [Candidatus Levybacteria bacterium]|nr:hypothetical protein [Candidatus Levybacteria bacterium]